MVQKVRQDPLPYRPTPSSASSLLAIVDRIRKPLYWHWDVVNADRLNLFRLIWLISLDRLGDFLLP